MKTISKRILKTVLLLMTLFTLMGLEAAEWGYQVGSIKGNEELKIEFVNKTAIKERKKFYEAVEWHKIVIKYQYTTLKEGKTKSARVTLRPESKTVGGGRIYGRSGSNAITLYQAFQMLDEDPYKEGILSKTIQLKETGTPIIWKPFNFDNMADPHYSNKSYAITIKQVKGVKWVITITSR